MWCLHQMAAPRREPGSRFLSSLNKSSRGGHGASAVPAAMPWAPAPSPPGSTRRCLGEPGWNSSPSLPWARPAIPHTAGRVQCASAQTQNLWAAPAPSKLRAQPEQDLLRWTNPPGWARRGQADADAWPTKPSSALLPFPNFQRRTPPCPTQNQKQHLRPNQTDCSRCWDPPWPAHKSSCVPSYITSIFAGWLLLSFPSHISTSRFREDDVKAPFIFKIIATPQVGVFSNKSYKVKTLHVKLQLKVGFSSDMNSVQASYLLKTDETSPNSFWIAELLKRPGGVQHSGRFSCLSPHV